MSSTNNQALQISVSEVVTYLRIEGGFSEALANVVRRKYLLQAADEAGVSASAEELQRAVDAYRAIHGLHKAADTQAWMTNNGISVEALEQHLAENIRISKARDYLAEKNTPAIAETPAVKSLIRELAVEDWITQQMAE